MPWHGAVATLLQHMCQGTALQATYVGQVCWQTPLLHVAEMHPAATWQVGEGPEMEKVLQFPVTRSQLPTWQMPAGQLPGS